MMVGDAGSAGLGIEAVSKGVTNRVDAPAGATAGLEDGHIMSGPAEFVRRRKAGQSRANDDHSFRSTRASQIPRAESEQAAGRHSDQRRHGNRGQKLSACNRVLLGDQEGVIS
jgi:hypothetical protein